MNNPKVTLVTSLQYPQLRDDEQALPQLLEKSGITVELQAWNDESVDWDNAGICILCSLGDYDSKSEKFLEWARSIKHLMNPIGIISWNRDRHFLKEFAAQGINVVPTIWLESESNLSKIQVHSRFPSSGDFVVKPAMYTAGIDVGRYCANSVASRGEAIEHAMKLLGEGYSVMVQKYLEEIDHKGEISLIYFNGILSHVVEKAPTLHSSYKIGESVPQEEYKNIEITPEIWEFSEKVRAAIHKKITSVVGHDLLSLYARIDIVPDGQGSFYLMDASLIDSRLYFASNKDNLEKFANAIAARVYW